LQQDPQRGPAVFIISSISHLGFVIFGARSDADSRAAPSSVAALPCAGFSTRLDAKLIAVRLLRDRSSRVIKMRPIRSILLRRG